MAALVEMSFFMQVSATQLVGGHVRQFAALPWSLAEYLRRTIGVYEYIEGDVGLMPQLKDSFFLHLNSTSTVRASATPDLDLSGKSICQKRHAVIVLRLVVVRSSDYGFDVARLNLRHLQGVVDSTLVQVATRVVPCPPASRSIDAFL
jgi:hypothetical protein